MPEPIIPIAAEVRTVQSGAAQEVLAIESLIKRKVEALDKIKAERRQKKEMYDDSFKSNPTFVENSRKAKDAASVKKRTVLEIAKQPQVASLKKELEDLALSQRQQERSLSELLLDYTGKRPEATQLELFDGRFATIQKSAKLSRPSKPKKRRFR
jgi:hypothetical protein